jgi:hypothetical protein
MDKSLERKETREVVWVNLRHRPSVETLLGHLQSMGVTLSFLEAPEHGPELRLLGGRVRWLGTPEGLDAGLVLEMVRRTLQSPPYLAEPVREWVRSFPDPRTIRVWIRKGCGYCVPTVMRALDLVLEQPRFMLDIIDAEEIPDRRPPEPLLAVPYLYVEETGRSAYGIPSHRELFGLLVPTGAREGPSTVGSP